MQNINFKKTRKPLVVYFHRYSLEYESLQFPITKRIIEMLLPKYDVLYFSMKSTKPRDKKLRKGIKIKEINLKVDNSNGFDKWFKTFLYYLLLPIILIELKRLKPSFIICKETLPFIPFFIKMLNIPMLIDTSDWWWSILLGNKKSGRKIANFMENLEVKRWSSPNVTVVAHTKAEAKLSIEKGFPEKRIKIINAPLSKEIYFPYKAEKERKLLGLKKTDFAVAVHGIIHPSKGYDQLLDWWKKLSKQHENWKLIIIGGSVGESWCRNRIKELNISENAIMTGWLPNQEEVNKYLNAADCLLVTRRNSPENLGIIPSSLYHNLILGKPVVATGLPGMSEIIENKKNGFLYEPDNFNSFKSILEFIYQNPKESLKIAKQGVKRGNECFNPEKSARQYVEVIDNAIIRKHSLI